MANYYDSAFGVAQYIHVNEPDTKFKPENPEFKVDFILEGAPALAFKEKVDAQCEAAFEAFKETERYASMKPKDQRELTIYRPYEEEEDDEGNKTGRIIFNFKQNARIKLKDGTVKAIKIGIYDASGTKEIHKPVTRGSVLRVRYSFRALIMPQLKKVGIRMDFAAVQIKELASGGASGGGFGAVEGYEDDGATYDSPAQQSGSDSADY